MRYRAVNALIQMACLCVIGFRATAGDPTGADYLEDQVARAQLEQMLHHQRHGTEEMLVPCRARPEVAASFLTRQVNSGLTAEETQRAGDIARFYVVRSSVPLFTALLTKREQTAADLMRAIECLRVLGDLGDRHEQKEAGDYFRFLLAHPRFSEVVPQMLECYVHLGPHVTEEKLAAAIRRCLTAVAARRASAAEPDTEQSRFREFLDGDLPVAKRAKSQKETLLAEQDPLKRATGLARLYLGLDSFGMLDWPKWSAFALMAELKRSNDTTVLVGLKSALAAIPAAEAADFKTQARARAFKAIRFFHGQLQDDEQRLLEREITRRFQLQG